jgi:hypothetical protein
VGERVVVYARGTPDEIRRQIEWCRAHAERNHQTIVALAQDGPDQNDAWHDVNRMCKDGRVDGILTASRRVIPCVESVTGALPSGRPPRRDAS